MIMGILLIVTLVVRPEGIVSREMIQSLKFLFVSRLKQPGKESI
jgi:hypothetical protein